jgi:hypothetical protein
VPAGAYCNNGVDSHPCLDSHCGRSCICFLHDPLLIHVRIDPCPHGIVGAGGRAPWPPRPWDGLWQAPGAWEARRRANVAPLTIEVIFNHGREVHAQSKSEIPAKVGQRRWRPQEKTRQAPTRGPKSQQAAAAEVCCSVYKEVEKFSRTHPLKINGCELGFRILYGPPVLYAEYLFIGYQPGGSCDSRNERISRASSQRPASNPRTAPRLVSGA